MDDSATKLCSKCGAPKMLAEFYSGRGQCKTCIKERVRRYREANREAIAARRPGNSEADLESKRRYREANREAIRESQLRYRENHRDEARERSHTYYYENRQQQTAWQREYYASHRDEILARDRVRYRVERMRAWRLYFKHGMQPGDWDAMWDAQFGRCYLCSAGLIEDKAVIDHDHSHCPAEQSCWICRRGLACSNCNSTIGLAGDDPARLRRIADALEAAQLEVSLRKDSAPGLDLGKALVNVLLVICPVSAQRRS